MRKIIKYEKYEKDRLRNAAKIRRGCVRVEITFERRERGEEPVFRLPR